MKKAIFIPALLMALVSCGNATDNPQESNDTLGTSPSAIDAETQHPTGVTNQNVISTDTAAMNAQKMSDTTGAQ